jgi:hypothetical protein
MAALKLMAILKIFASTIASNKLKATCHLSALP